MLPPQFSEVVAVALQFPKLLALGLILSLLTACGGGSGSSKEPTTPAKPVVTSPDSGDSGDSSDTNQPDSTVNTTWQLASNLSHLNFPMTKKVNTVEIGHFTTLTGSIDEAGNAQLSIQLSSVDTANSTRDQRLGDHLFDIARFPLADAKVDIDYQALTNLSVGTETTLSTGVILTLHGITETFDAQLTVARLTASRISVRTAIPVLIDARTYQLEDGIETLKTLAGLNSIGVTVPVDLHLVFDRLPGA